MSECLACKKEFADTFKFCLECGQPLSGGDPPVQVEITLEVPPKLWREVSAAAAKSKKSYADVVVIALEKYLAG